MNDSLEMVDLGDAVEQTRQYAPVMWYADSFYVLGWPN